MTYQPHPPPSCLIAPLFSRSRTKYFKLFISLFCVTYGIIVNENAIIVETYVKFKTNGSANFSPLVYLRYLSTAQL